MEKSEELVYEDFEDMLEEINGSLISNGQYEKLAAENISLIEEVEKTKNENKKLQGKINELTSIVSSKEDTSSLKDQITKLQEENNRLHIEIEATRLEEQEKTDQITCELQKSINEFNQQKLEYQKQIKYLTDRNKSLNTAIIRYEEKLQESKKLAQSQVQLVKGKSECADRDWKKEFENANNENSKNMLKIKQLQHMLGVKDNEIYDLKVSSNQSSKLIAESEKLKSELSIVNTARQKSEREIKQLKAKIEYLKNKFNALEKVYTDKVIKKDELIEELHRNFQDIKGSEISQTNSTIIETKNLERELKTEKERAERAERRIDNMKTELEKLEAENVQIRAKITEQEDDIEYKTQLESKIEKLEKENTAYSDRILRERVAIKSQVDKMKQEFSDKSRQLQIRVSDLERRLSLCAEERESLRNLVNSMKEEASSQCQSQFNANNELKEAKLRIVELEKQLSENQACNTNIPSKVITQQSAKLADLEIQLSKSREEIENLEKQLGERNQERKSSIRSTARIATLDAELVRAQSACKELERMKQSAAQNKTKLEEIQKKNAELTKKISNLENELSSARAELSSVQSKLENSSQRTPNRRTQELTKQNEEMKQKIEELEGTVEDIALENEELNRQVFALESKLRKQPKRSPRGGGQEGTQGEREEVEAQIKAILERIGARPPRRAQLGALVGCLAQRIEDSAALAECVVSGLSPEEQTTIEGAKRAISSAKRKLAKAEKTERKYKDAKQVIETLREVAYSGNERTCLSAIRALFLTPNPRR